MDLIKIRPALTLLAIIRIDKTVWMMHSIKNGPSGSITWVLNFINFSDSNGNRMTKSRQYSLDKAAAEYERELKRATHKKSGSGEVTKSLDRATATYERQLLEDIHRRINSIKNGIDSQLSSYGSYNKHNKR